MLSLSPAPRAPQVPAVGRRLRRLLLGPRLGAGWLQPGRARLQRNLHCASGDCLGAAAAAAEVSVQPAGLLGAWCCWAADWFPCAVLGCDCRLPSLPAQLIILLEFIYVVNEWLLERDQCAWALVASTALLVCGSFVGIGFLYHVSPAVWHWQDRTSTARVGSDNGGGG